MERDAGDFILPIIVVGIWLGLAHACEEQKAKVELPKTEQGCVKEEAK